MPNSSPIFLTRSWFKSRLLVLFSRLFFCQMIQIDAPPESFLSNRSCSAFPLIPSTSSRRDLTNHRTIAFLPLFFFGIPALLWCSWQHQAMTRNSQELPEAVPVSF